jgi:HAD superfamily hydrolase (TIGR01509 family)
MRLPRSPAAVVFDLDGLLFDTEKLYGEAILSAAMELGCEMSLDVFHSIVGTPWQQNRCTLLEHYGETFPADALRETWYRHFNLLIATNVPLKPGVIELLDCLDDLRLPRAIATSNSHQTVRHHLSAHDLGARFHGIVAHGDYAASKPAPDPFLRAAELLEVDPRHCLALEDSLNGIRSASAAGMMAVMVPDILEPTSEIRGLCTLIVRDLHEVRDLVLAG